MRKSDFADVSYGKHPLQKMDLYVPEKNKYFPVILLIHGGGFYCCDKRDFHICPAEVFLKMGFAVVSVNYRMAPLFPYPYPQRDIGKAIRWIRKYGAKYGLDKSYLFLHGTSAGGNLAAVEGLKAGCVGQLRAVALLCPVICIGTLEQELLRCGKAAEKNIPEIRKICELYLGEKKNLMADADFYIRKHQLYHVPVYIQHGDCDKLVCLCQSENFIEKLQQAGWEDTFLEVLIGVDHAGVGTEFYEWKTVERIGLFFKRYLNE